MSNGNDDTQGKTATADTSAAPGSTPSTDGQTAAPTLTAEQVEKMVQQAATNAAAGAIDAVRQEVVQAQQAAARQQPQAVQQDGYFGDLADDDWITAGSAKVLAENFSSRLAGFQQGIQHLYNTNIATMEQNSRLLHPDVWQKYGNELKDIVEQRKQERVITATDFDEAIEVIRGRHWEDLVDAQVQERLGSLPTSETATGDTGFTTQQQGETVEIPENWKRLLADNGLNASDVRQMLEKRRQQYGTAPTLEEYIKQMQRHDVIYDQKLGFTSTDLTKKVGS